MSASSHSVSSTSWLSTEEAVLLWGKGSPQGSPRWWGNTTEGTHAPSWNQLNRMKTKTRSQIDAMRASSKQSQVIYSFSGDFSKFVFIFRVIFILRHVYTLPCIVSPKGIASLRAGVTGKFWTSQQDAKSQICVDWKNRNLF